jgi:hypothetical protein
VPAVVSLPPHSYCLLVRTDFADDFTWARIVEEATAPSDEGFLANVEPLDDPAQDGVGWEALRDAAMLPVQPDHSSVLFVADATTMRSADHPILVVSTSRFHRDEFPDEFAAMLPFRCVPSKLWSVENNLNLANMDWRDFAGHVDPGGVFRGF